VGRTRSRAARTRRCCARSPKRCGGEERASTMAKRTSWRGLHPASPAPLSARCGAGIGSASRGRPGVRAPSSGAARRVVVQEIEDDARVLERDPLAGCLRMRATYIASSRHPRCRCSAAATRCTSSSAARRRRSPRGRSREGLRVDSDLGPGHPAEASARTDTASTMHERRRAIVIGFERQRTSAWRSRCRRRCGRAAERLDAAAALPERRRSLWPQ